MWSGPRNLSTALMYAFSNLPGCTAIDEPLYAAYLAKTGLDHPMRDLILRSQPTEIETAIAGLVEPSGLQYEKHMTHHLLPEFPRTWLRDVKNVYLIRHPARVIASYHAKRENPTLEDLGFVQQVELFDTFGGIVVDSADILSNPRSTLQALCGKIGICFDEKMLSWPKGAKPFDGIWATHWYGSVHQSTGFSGSEAPLPELKGAGIDLLNAALPYYEKLKSGQ